jgi:IS5 family transposase
MGVRDGQQIPVGTVAVVRAACPRGTRVTRLRDVLGPVFDDARFAGWFADEGRAGVAPGLLALVCVLQAMEDLSDRAAADAVRTRLDWKYALGLELTDTGFDFSVLCEFRDRLCVQDRAQELLTAMLECADAAGLLRRRGKVRTDSTHVLARTRTLNRLEKLGEAFRLALEQIAGMAPGWLAPRLKPRWAKEFTRPVQIGRLPQSDRARQQWGRQVAADGAWLLEQIDTDPTQAWLARLPAVQALRTIWAQECVVDDAGTWHLRTTRIDPGAEHIDTPHDAEARWSSKRSTQWSGYKAHLSETCDDDLPHLIVAIHTTAATESDIPALDDVHTRLAANQATPGEHYLDEGYVTAEAIHAAQADQIEIVGPLTRDSSWQAKQNNGYDKSAFILDWDTQQATCPQGRTSYSWTRRAHMAGDGAAIRFRHADCQACPARPSCTRSQFEGRQIVVASRALHEIQAHNRTQQNDPGWNRRYDRRAGIEGTISEAVRAFGLRRTRYIGMARTAVGHVLTACAINAARIADWTERSNQPTRPRSPSPLTRLFSTTPVTAS